MKIAGYVPAAINKNSVGWNRQTVDLHYGLPDSLAHRFWPSFSFYFVLGYMAVHVVNSADISQLLSVWYKFTHSYVLDSYNYQF